mmetsp:Transcript_15210/g.39166  ORF Transcript_15210/g.39166 Transcript_15210/m.39166 type:complete len:110 (-) Transcript_15210:28-357(-)
MSSTRETSLGRAMTPAERCYLSQAFLDIASFDYRYQPKFDREYFRAKYPGFGDDVIDILVLYERGIRFKEFKALLKKGRIPKPAPALVEIKRYEEGYSPFEGGFERMSS